MDVKFITRHTTGGCWHTYDDTHLISLKYFSRSRSMGPKAAYIANFDLFFGYALLAEEHLAAPYLSYNHVIYLFYLLVKLAAPEEYLTNYKRPIDDGWYIDSGNYIT